MRSKQSIVWLILAVSLGWCLLCGCSTRTITVGEYTYKSTRFLTKENFGALTVETNKLTLKGYQNEQSAEALGVILGTALKAAK